MKFTSFILLCLLGCNLIYETKSPNVIFILTDQWRAEALGYSGDPNVHTPNLDAFAKKAVNFNNTVSVCPVCTPYRASLLTGKFPTATGMMLNDIYLPSEEYCMAEMFADAGYKTAYIGKWHLDGHGRRNNVEPARRQGFQFWMADECCHTYDSCFYYENDNPEINYWEGYSPYAKVNAAKSYLKQSRTDSQPFLLSNRTPVTTSDILPTLLSMCNIAIPATIQGDDLSNIFLHPETEKDRAALISHPCPFSQTWQYPGYRAVRTMQYSYIKTASGPFMLFDNPADPQQLKNLVNNAEFEAIQNKLDNTLDSVLKKTGDYPIRERQHYLQKFGLEPNAGRYTYKYMEVQKADSPETDNQ